VLTSHLAEQDAQKIALKTAPILDAVFISHKLLQKYFQITCFQYKHLTSTFHSLAVTYLMERDDLLRY
jgi:hypothetical protein